MLRARTSGRATGSCSVVMARSLPAEDAQRSDERHERRDHHGRDEERPLSAGDEPEPDEPDPDPVQAVDQHPRQEDHVQGQEGWAEGDVDERVPGLGPGASSDSITRWR